MIGKILLAKGVPFTQMGGSKVLLVPFTMASGDNNYLHEPNYNLTVDELNAKNNIVSKIKSALVKSGIALTNIDTINFSSMVITIKVM